MDLFGGLRRLLGIQSQQQQRRPAEDDAVVESQNGDVPLSSLMPGQPWRPTGYTQGIDGVVGAFDPSSNIRRGGTVYAPGEGLRTQPLPDFAEILKRLR